MRLASDACSDQNDPPVGRQLVYLVPGFFGFTKLGPFEYFIHVQAALRRHLPDPDWSVFVVPTPPTASLTERAKVLLDTIEETAERADAIHLIGHSSGGLDVRLVATPSATFDPRARAIAPRIRTIVTVTTPHRGTPLASAFDGVMGKQLLALTTGAALGGLRLGTKEGPLTEYLRMIGRDQGLLTQLTPDALDVLNATTPDAPAIRYGCVVAMTPGRPRTPLYSSLRRLSIRMPKNRAAQLTPAEADLLGRAFGRTPTWQDSDGIVPSRSQVWGDLIHAAEADHLDVLGHYDWLRSGAPFRAEHLELLWSDVARFLAGDDVTVVPPERTPSLWSRYRRTALRATAVLVAYLMTGPLVEALDLSTVRFVDAACFGLIALLLVAAVDRIPEP